MTEDQLREKGEATLALQSAAREAGLGCKCPCGCAYILASSASKSAGVCFGCRAHLHYGSWEPGA